MSCLRPCIWRIVIVSIICSRPFGRSYGLIVAIESLLILRVFTLCIVRRFNNTWLLHYNRLSKNPSFNFWKLFIWSIWWFLSIWVTNWIVSKFSRCELELLVFDCWICVNCVENSWIKHFAIICIIITIHAKCVSSVSRFIYNRFWLFPNLLAFVLCNYLLAILCTERLKVSFLYHYIVDSYWISNLVCLIHYLSQRLGFTSCMTSLHWRNLFHLVSHIGEFVRILKLV